MTEYMVYFEFFGRKMKMRVEANSQREAENIIRQKVAIRKIEELPPGTEQDTFIQDFLDLLNKHKHK